MSLGSEFNVHPILQLVPHDTENTALIMSWLDTVTVSDKRKKSMIKIFSVEFGYVPGIISWKSGWARIFYSGKNILYDIEITFI